MVSRINGLNACKTFNLPACVIAKEPMGDESIEIYDSLDARLRDKWDEFVYGASPYLQSQFCNVLGQTLDGILEYRYVIFKREGKWIGIAPMQITSALTSSIDNNLPQDNTAVKLLVQGLSFGKKELEFNVLVVGNSFISGEHGYYFSPEISIREAARLIHDATIKIERAQRETSNRISATVIKDFVGLTKEADAAFGRLGYFDFQVDPNMIMPILPTWDTFDDYLRDLNSKYRTKAKAALKKSSEVEIRDMKSDEIAELAEDVTRLYTEVHSRADFKLGELTADTFVQLKEKLKSQFLFKGYFFKGELIAFQSGFVHKDVLEAYMVGIDYSFNQRLALYQTMLYTYINESIRQQVDYVNFGRTAMEIKSTVGASEQALHCFIRHRSSIPNKFLGMLFGFVKPTDYQIRIPWRKEVLVQHPELVRTS